MMGDFALDKLSSSWKVLITGVVLTLCLGYLAAVANAALSVGVSVDATIGSGAGFTCASFIFFIIVNGARQFDLPDEVVRDS